MYPRQKKWFHLSKVIISGVSSCLKENSKVVTSETIGDAVSLKGYKAMTRCMWELCNYTTLFITIT